MFDLAALANIISTGAVSLIFVGAAAIFAVLGLTRIPAALVYLLAIVVGLLMIGHVSADRTLVPADWAIAYQGCAATFFAIAWSVVYWLVRTTIAGRADDAGPTPKKSAPKPALKPKAKAPAIVPKRAPLKNYRRGL